MKSPARINSELIEIRFCYLLVIYVCTSLWAFGFIKVLWHLILFLPFIRVIHLYGLLPKTPVRAVGITMTSLLTLLFVLYYGINIAFFTAFGPDPKNESLFHVLWIELLLTLIFHRYLFFWQAMPVSKYLLPVYRVFKKYYLDIVLCIICYIGFEDGLYNIRFGFLLYLKQIWIRIGEIFWFYAFCIALSGLWYLVIRIVNGVLHRKNRNSVERNL